MTYPIIFSRRGEWRIIYISPGYCDQPHECVPDRISGGLYGAGLAGVLHGAGGPDPHLQHQPGRPHQAAAGRGHLRHERLRQHRQRQV